MTKEIENPLRRLKKGEYRYLHWIYPSQLHVESGIIHVIMHVESGVIVF